MPADWMAAGACVGSKSDWGDPLLGALRVRRYGWETTGVVRINAAGEVFVRLDPNAVAGPLFRPVPDEEEAW